MLQDLLILTPVAAGEIFQGSVLFISLCLAPNQDCCCCFSGSVNLFWSHIGSGSCCGSSVAELWFTCSSQVLMALVRVCLPWALGSKSWWLWLHFWVLWTYLFKGDVMCSLKTSAVGLVLSNEWFFWWSSVRYKWGFVLQLQQKEDGTGSHKVFARRYLSHGRCNSVLKHSFEQLLADRAVVEWSKLNFFSHPFGHFQIKAMWEKTWTFQGRDLIWWRLCRSRS